VTREEILALTDDEMRIEVAKARGFHVEAIPSNPPGVKPLYALVDAGGDFVGDWYYSPANCWYSAPNYPDDISLAWPLLCELGNSFTVWRKGCVGDLVIYDERWEEVAGVEFRDPAEFARAICRVWLLAKAVSA
jgi:hypothetical protein